MTPPVTAFVAGHPAPQGSKRHVGNGVLVESSARVKPWRQDVRETFLLDGKPIRHYPRGTTLAVTLAFVLPRPKALAKNAPVHHHTRRPDLDKLIRAVLDAIGSAGVWHDDAQVAFVQAHKRYATHSEATGCRITITEAPE